MPGGCKTWMANTNINPREGDTAVIGRKRCFSTSENWLGKNCRLCHSGHTKDFEFENECHGTSGCRIDFGSQQRVVPTGEFRSFIIGVSFSSNQPICIHNLWRMFTFQIKTVLDDLTIKCQRIVRSVDLSSSTNPAALKHMLSERPDIIVSTPAKVLSQLKLETVNLKDGLETIVIDEADLVFSFGFEKDLKDVLEFLPPIYQVNINSIGFFEAKLCLINGSFFMV